MPGAGRKEASPCWRSNSPILAGPRGRTIELDGSDPTLFTPSFSQNKPVTVSQPSSALRSRSCFWRHCLIEFSYGVSAAQTKASAIPSKISARIVVTHDLLYHSVRHGPLQPHCCALCSRTGGVAQTGAWIVHNFEEQPCDSLRIGAALLVRRHAGDGALEAIPVRGAGR